MVLYGMEWYGTECNGRVSYGMVWNPVAVDRRRQNGAE